jgi:hypothetical protein
MKPSLKHTLFLVPVLALGIGSASAANPPTKPAATVTLPTWERLSQAERDMLVAPVRERWNTNPEQRARMLEHAKRWQTMTPEQRQRAHHGMKRWAHMNPERRTEMRALFEKMRTLPPEQREALKKQWRAMTPEQRQAWLQQNAPKR